MSDAENQVTQLGAVAKIAASPEEAELERVSNPHADTNYLARFTCPEFTSLCPVTGQPDFAHLVIDYVPGDWLLESKSLKLYLAAFRNHGAFHEDCTVAIGKRITALLSPASCELVAIGILAAASRLTFSGRAVSALKGCGCRTRGLPHSEGAAKA